MLNRKCAISCSVVARSYRAIASGHTFLQCFHMRERRTLPSNKTSEIFQGFFLAPKMPPFNKTFV